MELTGKAAANSDGAVTIDLSQFTKAVPAEELLPPDVASSYDIDMVRSAANLGASKDPENLMGELSEIAAKVTRGELQSETAQIWSAWRGIAVRLGSDPQSRDLLKSPQFLAFSAAIANLQALEAGDPTARHRAMTKLTQAEKAFLSVAHTVPQGLIRTTMQSLRAIAADLRTLEPTSLIPADRVPGGDAATDSDQLLPDATTWAVLQETEAQVRLVKAMEKRPLNALLADKTVSDAEFHIALNAIGYRLAVSPQTGERSILANDGRKLDSEGLKLFAQQLAVAASAGVAGLTALTSAMDPDQASELHSSVLGSIAKLRALLVTARPTDESLPTEAAHPMAMLKMLVGDDLASGVIFKPIIDWVDQINTLPEERDKHIEETVKTHQKLLAGDETEQSLLPDERAYADYLVSVGQMRKDGHRYVTTLSKDQTAKAVQVLNKLGDPASREGRLMRELMVQALADKAFMAALRAEMATIAQQAAHPGPAADRRPAAESHPEGDESAEAGTSGMASPGGLRAGLVFDDVARRDAAAERKTLAAAGQQADEHQQQLVEASQQRQAFDDLYEAQRAEFQKTVTQGMA